MPPTEEEIADGTRIIKEDLKREAREKIKATKEIMQPTGEVCPHYSIVGQNLTDAIGTYMQECLVCRKRRIVSEWE